MAILFATFLVGSFVNIDSTPALDRGVPKKLPLIQEGKRFEWFEHDSLIQPEIVHFLSS